MILDILGYTIDFFILWFTFDFVIRIIFELKQSPSKTLLKLIIKRWLK